MAPSRLRLRGALGVPEVRDVEPQHHRVVLVDRVVAVHRVLPVEVTEAEEQGGRAVRLQSEHVLAADLDEGGEGGYGGGPAPGPGGCGIPATGVGWGFSRPPRL